MLKVLPIFPVLPFQLDLLKSSMRLLKNHCEYSFTRVVRLFQDSNPVEGIGRYLFVVLCCCVTCHELPFHLFVTVSPLHGVYKYL